MPEEQNEAVEIENFIRDIITERSLDKTKIIIMLQAVQEKFGYLSRNTITNISTQLRTPEIDIYGVATFYEQFRFTKPGKHLIKVCEGTACHVKGGAAITETIERELGIGPGETTADGLFSLERVACLGCCALAPVIVIDEEIFGMMSTSKTNSKLQEYNEKTETTETTDTIDTTGGE